MRHAFFVTSSIELDPNKNFKGTRKRTVFTTQDRLEHTILTLRNLQEQDPTAPIYMIDSSVTKFNELNQLGIPNFHYIQLQELNPVVADIVRSHTSKSHCECLMILEFFKHYKKELEQYDFITKICGRYWFYQGFSKDLYTPENTNKYFMKQEMIWANEHIDFLSEIQLPRDMLVDNRLHGLYTVAHGIGREKLSQYEAIMAASAAASEEYGKYYHQDVEYTLHLYLRLFDQLKDVITVGWQIDGRCGVTGDWVRY